MNYHTYRFPVSNERMGMIDRERNFAPAMPPFDTVCHVRMENPQFYQRYSGNVLQCFPSYPREFSPLNNAQYPRGVGPFGRPTPDYEWNFHSNNVPNCTRNCDGSGSYMAHLPPHNRKYRTNSLYNQSGNEKFYSEAYEESPSERNYITAGNAVQCDPHCSQRNKFATIRPTSIEWDCRPFQVPAVAIHIPEHQKNEPSPNICSDVEYRLCFEKEIPPRITNPIEYSPSKNPASLETPVNIENSPFRNFPEIDGNCEVMMPLASSIQIENIEDNLNSEEFEKVLNSPDENSLAVYFLNNLYPESETMNSLPENPLKDQIIQPKDCMMNLEEKQVSLSKENVINPISGNFISDDLPEKEITAFPKNLNDVSRCSDNADSSKHLETNTPEVKINSKCKNGTENCDQETISNSQPSTENICLPDNTHENKEIMYDRIEKELNKYKEWADCHSKSGSSCLQNEKTADRNFILHAPIINISQQNQISRDNSKLFLSSSSSSDLSDSKISDDFSNKLCHYFSKGVMEMLFSLQNNNALQEVLSTKKIPDKTCDEENSNLLDGQLLSCNFIDNNFQLNESHFTSNIKRKNSTEQNSTPGENEILSCSSDYGVYNNNIDLSIKNLENIPVTNTRDKNDSNVSGDERMLPSTARNSVIQSKNNSPISYAESTKNSFAMESNSTPNELLLANENLPVLNFKESDFMYSNILDSEDLLSQLETSLSSITNYVLDEPTHAELNNPKETLTTNAGECPSISSATQLSRHQKNEKKRMKDFDIAKILPQTPASDDNYLTSDELNPGNLTHSDNIDQAHSINCLPFHNDMQKTKNKEPGKRKRKSRSSSKRKGSKKAKRSKTSTSKCLNHKAQSNDNKSKTSLSQYLIESNVDIAVQTIPQINAPVYNFPCTRDAQTQCNIADIGCQNVTELRDKKISNKHEILRNKDSDRTGGRETNLVTDNQRRKFGNGSETSNRNLRTRLLKSENKKENSETNVNKVGPKRNSRKRS